MAPRFRRRSPPHWARGVQCGGTDLAVRVLRHPVARGSYGAVTLGSGRRLANDLWTNAECPSDPVSAAGFAEGDCELVPDLPAATAGKDWTTPGEACALLLAIAGGRTSEPAAAGGEVCPKRVGGRSVAKVGHQWRNFGGAGCGSHTDSLHFG
jgi:hypothetical protein